MNQNHAGCRQRPTLGQQDGPLEKHFGVKNNERDVELLIVRKEEGLLRLPCSHLSDRFSSQQQSRFPQLLLMIKSARHQMQQRPQRDLKESLLEGVTTLNKHEPRI